jgi:hypothetical protein
MIRVCPAQVSKQPPETMPRNHPKPSETMAKRFRTFTLIHQWVSSIFERNRNHRRHSTETTETMSIHMVSWYSDRPGKTEFPFSRGLKTMAKNANAMADEYIVGTRGRLIYLHFGQETDEEKAERQALLLRVADSLGVAVLSPAQRKGTA